MRPPDAFAQIRAQSARDRDRIRAIRLLLHAIDKQLDMVEEELGRAERGIWRPELATATFLRRTRVAVRSMDQSLARRDLRAPKLPPLRHPRRRRRSKA